MRCLHTADVHLHPDHPERREAPDIFETIEAEEEQNSRTCSGQTTGRLTRELPLLGTGQFPQSDSAQSTSRPIWCLKR
ncbi:MAG: hypothetical protein U5K37_10040 [Natrialbaceae archaeon]|nr:hypothetical protein [Natrialbaceae archaeon]